MEEKDFISRLRTMLGGLCLSKDCTLLYETSSLGFPALSENL